VTYDERLADEIRERLAEIDGAVTEKRMFESEADLDAWITRALAFISTLPSK
jgi:hypothetical protein